MEVAVPGYTVVRLNLVEDINRGCKFSEDHNFTKPVDESALKLMNDCAEKIMQEDLGITLAYGQNDEYTFLFKTSTASNIMCSLTSKFAGYYVMYWNTFFPTTKLKYPPCFEGATATLPNLEAIKDYLRWRQVECHNSSMYIACCWTLVQSGMTLKDAEEKLLKTDEKDKNELLLGHNMDYDTLPDIFRKGSCLVRTGRVVSVTHEDLEGESFWTVHPDIL